MPSLYANATNAVGLWPGSLSGAYGFKAHFPKVKGVLKQLWLPTLLGSCVGAWLLSHTSESLFKSLVPILILIAAVMLNFQKKLQALWLDRPFHASAKVGIILQFIISVYGGYFGAGMGIMMLAAFGLYLQNDLNEMNAVKNWLAVLINLSCSTIFWLKGLVYPVAAVALVIGALIGGYVAAHASQRVPQEKLRTTIAVYGYLIAAYFTYRYFAGK